MILFTANCLRVDTVSGAPPPSPCCHPFLEAQPDVSRGSTLIILSSNSYIFNFPIYLHTVNVGLLCNVPSIVSQ